MFKKYLQVNTNTLTLCFKLSFYLRSYCKLTPIPKGYWLNVDNQRKFLESISTKLGVSSLDDWKYVKTIDIIKLGGTNLLKKYPSYITAIKTIFPEQQWNEFEFNNLSRNFYSSIDNQRKCLDNLCNQLDLSSPLELSSFSSKELRLKGAQQVIKQYTTLFECLSSIYPEYSWNVLKFKRVPQNYWKLKSFQKEFLDNFALKMNIKEPKDWINITQKQIIEHGGSGLFNYSQYSLLEALKLVYPDVNWDDIFINKIRHPKGYWECKENHKKFLDEFAKTRNIKSVYDWSLVTAGDVKAAGGRSILKNYNSFYDCLCSIYPELDWNIDYWSQVPKNYWSDKNNVKIFINKLKPRLKIQSENDWYRISTLQIINHGGSGLLKHYNNRLSAILQLIYPHIHWDESRLSKKDKRSSQRLLYLQLQDIYKGYEVIEDYFHQELTRLSGHTIQFDIYIPTLKLAFEYQGEHHSRDIPSFGSYDSYQARDIEKKKICKKYNINLIIIPYHWDYTIHQLQSIITSNTSII